VSADATTGAGTTAGPTSLDQLLAEASRQLTICNACRYCEGFCAVFPALERRSLFSAGDVVQLANLCHDCRACFDACMYSPPHEFAVNPPLVLSAMRAASYERYAWPRTVPRVLRGRVGLLFGLAGGAALLLALAIATRGAHALVAPSHGAFSPYAVISYPAMLATFIAATCYGLVIMLVAGHSYWRDVGGTRIRRPELSRAVRAAVTLRNQRGGGGECYYPDDEQPSPLRRRLHHVVAGGFALCLVSTIAAGVLQDILGSDPPYPLVSVPVISGTLGGVAFVIGSIGLLELKRRSSPVTSYAAMTMKDYGLLAALALLGITGLALLALRDTPAYPVAFLVHLSAVLLAFVTWPYGKFVHLVYRFLALVRDEQELAAGSP
jgi:citrate/tricarballylate utilization protein